MTRAKAIKDILISELKEISTKNDYNTNVYNVFPFFPSYQEIEDTTIGVSLTNGSRTMLPTGVIEHTLNFAIAGYIKSDNDIEKQGELEESLLLLYDDICNVVLTPSSEIYTKASEVSANDYFIEAEGNVGLITIILTCKYYY